MGILSFILEGALFASLDLGLDAIKNVKEGKADQTIVELVIGSGIDGMDGKTPHIALWNEAGERLGQAGPTGKNKHDDKGKADQGGNPIYTIKHDQGHQGAGQASYMMLSNIDDDAICISAVYVTDDRLSTAIFGDLPSQCGMSWSHSNRDIGESHQLPVCFWLDNDGTGDLNAQAVSFHLRDMVANTDRIAQYNKNQDSICKSTPRFSFWGDLLPDSMIPIFSPPLEYEVDSKNSGIGADKDIDRVIDKKTIDKGVSMYQSGNLKRQPMNSDSIAPGIKGVPIPSFMLKKRDTRGPSGRRSRHSRLSNKLREQLIVTPHARHSAKELCESETSYGPDEVSLTERLFCDMDTKTLYPLCGDAGHKDNCFDLEAETLVLPQGSAKQDGVQVHARAVPIVKRYNSTAYW